MAEMAISVGAEVGENGEDAAVVVGRGEQAEFGEDAADVGFDGFGAEE
jgi:hypothetical protein